VHRTLGRERMRSGGHAVRVWVFESGVFLHWGVVIAPRVNGMLVAGGGVGPVVRHVDPVGGRLRIS
jgi:hypothetical protein